MALRLGDIALDFTTQTIAGEIIFLNIPVTTVYSLLIRELKH